MPVPTLRIDPRLMLLLLDHSLRTTPPLRGASWRLLSQAIEQRAPTKEKQPQNAKRRAVCVLRDYSAAPAASLFGSLKWLQKNVGKGMQLTTSVRHGRSLASAHLVGLDLVVSDCDNRHGCAAAMIYSVEIAGCCGLLLCW